MLPRLETRDVLALILRREVKLPQCHIHALRKGRPRRDLLAAQRRLALRKQPWLSLIHIYHCSFTLTQKDAGKGDFTKIPGGLPGVETRGILLYSEGVAKGRIPAEKMAEVLAENPAKLYGAFPRKGILAAGSDADIVVIDPTKTGLITASDQIANVDYTPFEGFRTQGVIEQVYLRGQLAVDHGEVQTGKIGQFIPRGVNSL